VEVSTRWCHAITLTLVTLALTQALSRAGGAWGPSTAREWTEEWWTVLVGRVCVSEAWPVALLVDMS